MDISLAKLTIIERIAGGDPLATILLIVCLSFGLAIVAMWMRSISSEAQIVSALKENSTVLSELSTLIKYGIMKRNDKE
jgi:hypothetical protein